jgi:hypothetical protein
MKRIALICVLALTGCLTAVTSSSRSYLGPDQSGATSARTPVDTAREVTRLFEVRGFALADQHAIAGGGYGLKLTKSNRGLAAAKGDDQYLGSNDVGSAFYVWIMPAQGGSTISMIGKPTLNGAEPCSKEVPELACNDVEVNDTFASTFMSGRTEADIVHGVLSELSLEGFATGSLPANASTMPKAPTLSPDAACLARRQQALAAAQLIADLGARAKLLEAAPECPAVEATLPATATR